MTLFWALLTTAVLSVLSFSGALVLTIRRSMLRSWLLRLVALAAGTMLGAAMFHLLPEAVEALPVDEVFVLVTVAFMLFFAIEKVLHWRHCHEDDCEEHAFGWLNLIGDSLHNLIDGLLIGGAFAVSTELGLVTALAVMIHEVPQEIGDFGVLLHAGWPVRKALLANFIVSLSSILGAALGVVLAEQSTDIAARLVPIAAGGFLYVAASDLIPELRKEKNASGSLQAFLFFSVGLIFMFLTSRLE